MFGVEHGQTFWIMGLVLPFEKIHCTPQARYQSSIYNLRDHAICVRAPLHGLRSCFSMPGSELMASGPRSNMPSMCIKLAFWHVLAHPLNSSRGDS